MGASAQEDLGSQIVVLDACSSENSGAPSVVTAGGTGDNSKKTGQTIDRYQDGGLAHSAVIATTWMAALTSAETLTLAHEIQYSDDGSTFDTAVVLEEATIVKTAGSTTNFRGTRSPAALQLDLRSQKRYFRVNVTPNLSKANTDLASFATTATLGGFDVVPQ